ncbi:hypothetical protein EP837_02854 [Sphingobium sp. EP60837]|nr:hypothetical protein EP837_02854 [Sphingobium sp. EP60837]
MPFMDIRLLRLMDAAGDAASRQHQCARHPILRKVSVQYGFADHSTSDHQIT